MNQPTTSRPQTSIFAFDKQQHTYLLNTPFPPFEAISSVQGLTKDDGKPVRIDELDWFDVTGQRLALHGPAQAPELAVDLDDRTDHRDDLHSWVRETIRAAEPELGKNPEFLTLLAFAERADLGAFAEAFGRHLAEAAVATAESVAMAFRAGSTFGNIVHAVRKHWGIH
jgi:hypothetical protein